LEDKVFALVVVFTGVLCIVLQGVCTSPHVVYMHCRIYTSHLLSSVISVSGMTFFLILLSAIYKCDTTFTA